MWSLGVLLYTMLAGQFPFQADSMEALGKKVMKGKPDRSLKASPDANALVHSMLVVRSSQRASIDAVCANTWLAPSQDEPPIDTAGAAGPVWDEHVGARLEAYGCPLALVQHHVQQGASNHVTAAFECLLHAGRSQSSAAGPAA